MPVRIASAADPTWLSLEIDDSTVSRLCNFMVSVAEACATQELEAHRAGSRMSENSVSTACTQTQ